MELVTERGNRKILAKCISSKPKISPKGLKAIFLAPFEWETMCSLYFGDLYTGKKQGLIGPIDEKYRPKDAVWISESVIALIIGDVCESIIDGGNLYIYEFKDNQLRKLINWDLRKQAVKLEYIGGVLYFEGIKYIEGKSKGFIGILKI